MPDTVFCQGNTCPARKVPVEILPLDIGRAKGKKHWGHLRGEKTSLGL
jgi:hypothetical protein